MSSKEILGSEILKNIEDSGKRAIEAMEKVLNSSSNDLTKVVEKEFGKIQSQIEEIKSENV